jgi:phenylacetic acid degradation operon negative regulatory protein
MDLLAVRDLRIFIKDLSSIETIKTWSLIVTMFGDLDDAYSQTMSGKEIGTLLGHIGVKPEAVRVALHRLKKGGWIIATKSGREVEYGLSQNGLSETAAVYEDVYRRTIKYPDGWKLLLDAKDEPNGNIGSRDGIQLFRNIVLVPLSLTTRDGSQMDIDFDQNDVPPWFVDRVVPSNIVDIADSLSTMAHSFSDEHETENSLDNAAIRLLFLHHWRKMALRDNTWAHIWLFEAGPMAQCHTQITEILERIPKLKPAQLKSG